MLLDLFFPKLCLGCNHLGCYICNACEKQIVFIEKEHCFYCKKTSDTGQTHYHCRQALGVNGWISLVQYNPMMKKIIAQIKYKFVSDAFVEIFRLLMPMFVHKIKKLINPNEVYVFQPIPLHSAKQKLRGFNQSSIIAKHFARSMDTSIVNVLIRIKNTQPQAQLKKE
jgi:competence protein ComFC